MQPIGYLNRAAFAADPAASRGRLTREPVSPTRTEFQRDRDRVIHSAAFRRLAHKTQVFVPHEGDHYRTRLTHTIEVGQIARALSRSLGLDEDLAESLALAHDLGHTPFGHTGEDVLEELMAPWGGFDHNAQALRIVTRLERRYAGFDGLNLVQETLEGLVKHNGPLLTRDGAPTQKYAARGVPVAILEFDAKFPLELSTFASAEAQAAAIADDIAYNAHDIDDGLRAGLFMVDDLRELDFALHQLKLAGVEIGTNVNGVPIGDPRFEPFFAAAAKWGAAIFVHPIRPAGVDRLVGPASLQPAVAFPGETGLAAASMISGGTLAKHPSLRIAYSHGGGTFASLLPRFQFAWETFPDLRQSIAIEPRTAARCMYYDSLVYDATTIRHLMKVFGETQVMVGTDYPFSIMDPDPAGRIDALELDDATRDLVCADNARRWLAID